MSCAVTRDRETERPRLPRHRRLRRQAALAAGFLLVLLGGTAVRAQDGEGLLLGSAEGGWQAAAMLETEVHMQVRGLLAEVEVRQRFVNTGLDWLEGRYLLPLPETAAVHALRVEAGGRVIEGEVREKQQARAEYAQAAAEGRRTALVEQHRPNLFRTRVANVGPGETVTVTVGYWQRVDYVDDVFALSLPLTLTPRYTPACGGGCAAEAPGPAANGVPVGMALEPTVALTVDLDPGLPLASVDSPTHAVDVRRDGERYQVTLRELVVAGDRDFALEWHPQPSAAVASALFRERVGADEYALVMLVPPTLPVASLPRELLLVVDTSGSMHGTSMDQARAAVQGALARLGPQDRFNVVRFASEAEALFEGPVPADAEHLAVARDWVSQFQADGGTELGGALDLALGTVPADGWLRQVVLVTDAAVGNEAELLTRLERELGEARLFPVGIGSAPNGHFLREAARVGRGAEVLVRELDEVEARMDALFAKLDRPALRDLDLDWPAGAEVYPQRLPDLYAGEPLLAVARLGGRGGAITAQGWSHAGEWRDALSLGAKAGADDAGVARLWAREKLAALDDAMRRGASEDAIRPEMIAVALEHHLTSRYTSLVAVDRTPARPQDATLASLQFANAAPAGSLAFAQGGTGSRSRLGMALALGLIALALAQCRRLAHNRPIA